MRDSIKNKRSKIRRKEKEGGSRGLSYMYILYFNFPVTDGVVAV